MLAYCMFSSYVMTGWGSAHCQHSSVLQLNQLLSASCSFCSAVNVQFVLTRTGTGCVNGLNTAGI